MAKFLLPKLFTTFGLDKLFIESVGIVLQNGEYRSFLNSYPLLCAKL